MLDTEKRPCTLGCKPGQSPKQAGQARQTVDGLRAATQKRHEAGFRIVFGFLGLGFRVEFGFRVRVSLASRDNELLT